MNLFIMNLFTNLIDTSLIAYFITKILGKTWINKKRWILPLIVLIILNTFMNSIFGLGNIIGFISIFIVSTIVYAYLLNTEFIQVFIYNILGTIIMLIIEIVFISITIIACKVDPSIFLEISLDTIILILVSKVTFYLIIKYRIESLRKEININFNNVEPNIMKPIIVVCFFNIINIFMTFTLYKNIEIKSNLEYLYIIGMGIGTIIFSWGIYKISKKVIYQSHQQIIWKMKEEEFHKKDFHLKSMKDILETIKSQRHDLNNYLSTLYGLIYLGKFEESKKYIVEINNRATNMNDIIETDHPVITSLITMKKNKAFEKNIHMVLHIDLLEELPCDFVDLSIIIGNLLDNAIEACELIKDETKRKIELSIYIKDEYLIIEIVNTKNETTEMEMKNIYRRFTTKVDHENHGYGLSNIKYVVEQYDGTMNIEDLGRQFRVDISLCIGEKSIEVQ